MTARVHNFSAGPGVLPETVLQEVQDSVWNFHGRGAGLLESSHRCAEFEAVIASARERLHRLLKCDEDQEVMFLHGGARTQFFQIPMNLLRGGHAVYHDTGTWSDKAIIEARRFGTVDVPFSSQAERYNRVPQPGDLDAPSKGTVYLHYTSNNTVAGSQYHHTPDSGEALLVCDASSDILSRPMDGSAFDVLYAGAQKNLGPAGTTIVVFRKSLLERCEKDIPIMCRYDTHLNKGSMYNTPCTFAIYTVERVAAWLEEQGGPEAMEEKNRRQARQVYDVIDATSFWTGKVERSSRSWMNVTFTTGNEDLDDRIAADAAAEGLIGIRGHRSVGGLRASLYNAQTDAAVEALVSFLKDAEARLG